METSNFGMYVLITPLSIYHDIISLKQDQNEDSNCVSANCAVASICSFSLGEDWWTWVGTANGEIVPISPQQTMLDRINLHESIVNVMISVGSEVWSCDHKTICITHKKTRNKILELSGHTGKISYLLLVKTRFGKHVWSSSFDKTILIWDTKTYNCLQELKGHADSITWLLLSSRFIWSLGANGETLIAWNYSNGMSPNKTRSSGSLQEQREDVLSETHIKHMSSKEYKATIGELQSTIKQQQQTIRNLQQQIHQLTGRQGK